MIEFPGLVKNPSKAIKCFKSISNIKNSFQGAALPLYFRPEDTSSRPIYGERKRTTSLLFKITVKRKKVCLDNEETLSQEEKNGLICIFLYYFIFFLIFLKK